MTTTSTTRSPGALLIPRTTPGRRTTLPVGAARHTRSVTVRTCLAVGVALAVLSGCGSGDAPPAADRASSSSPAVPSSVSAAPSVAGRAGLPTPDHVMVVIFENEDAENIVG